MSSAELCTLRDFSPYFAAYERAAANSIQNVAGVMPVGRIRDFFSTWIMGPRQPGLDDRFRELADELYEPLEKHWAGEGIYPLTLIKELAEIVEISTEAGANQAEIMRELHNLTTNRPDNPGWREEVEDFRLTW